MANSKSYILGLFPDNSNNEITAADMRIFINTIFDEEVDVVDIIDNLISTDQQKPLSANQGRILDERVTLNTSGLLAKENNIGVGATGQVLTTDSSGNKVWTTPQVFTETAVYDALDSISTTDALSANQGRILDLATNANSNSVTINANNINTNTIAINTITTTTIPTLDTRVTANEGNITSNTTNIGNNTTNITTNTNNITALDVRVTANEGNITANTTAISTNTTDVASIWTYVGINDTSGLSLRIAGNETDILTLQGQVGSVDASTLEAQVTQNTNDIVTVGGRIDANVTAIANNTANILVNANAIVSNTSSIASNTTTISTNTGSINTINTVTIPALDARITTNSTDVANLDTRVTQNEADILGGVASDAAQDILIQNNTDAINATSVQVGNNALDIYSNKDDIQVLQAGLINTDDNVATNAVNIENNRQNIVRNGNDITNTDDNVAALTAEVSLKEEGLGAPDIDGYVLGSLADGTRVWYPNAYSASDFVVLDNLLSAGNSTDALSANQGYMIDQRLLTKEPGLQNPARDNSVLASNADGTRFWAESNILDIDYGDYFGFGVTLTSISVSPSPVNIDNSEEEGTAQLIATATYHPSNGDPDIIVDVTDQVNWTSSNLLAFTINSGLGGGVITPINGIATDYLNEIATATLNGVSGGTNVNITNTSVLLSIITTPNPVNFTGTPVEFQQITATGLYSHNGASVDITNSVNWTSSDVGTATIGVSGLISSVATGTTIITAEATNIKGTVIDGTANVTVA